MNLRLILAACCGGILWMSSCAPSDKQSDADYASMVNLFIGTGGHGHTFPGAVVPHGLIQPSPDTRIDGWDACSGYYYADSTINGFSQSHLSGTGCADFGDFLLMPTVGEQVCNPQDYASQALPYASLFSHQKEVAEPGYYSVVLDRYNVKAEITSTSRAAIYRFTYPDAEDAGLILDLDYSIQHQTNLDMQVEAVSNTEIKGYKLTNYWAPAQQANFYAEFSEPFTYTLLRDTLTGQNGSPQPRCKMLLKFKTAKAKQILMKIGLSVTDEKGAKSNLNAEIPDWDFERVRKDARAAWNAYLSKINIKTTDKDVRTVFYTSLYHTAVSPNLLSDVDGRYWGMDKVKHQGDASKPIYTIFSLWDTFRALHPLYSIIAPEMNNRFVASLIQKHREGGILPMWDVASNYTATMIGYHAVSLIADAYVKGYADFDIKEAYAACIRAAEYDTTGIQCPKWMIPYLVPKAKMYKNTLGYIPCDLENESVAKALEYAYDDFCIALLAEVVGDCQNQEKYSKLSKAYETYFDPSVRFMRGIDSKRQWHVPFNPCASNHRKDDYCEGNAWQWTWFVPHDIDGLVRLMGGKRPL